MAVQGDEKKFTWLGEPPPRRSRWRRLELLLGLGLLMGVLSWTAWDAWRTEQLLAHYRAGVALAAQHDWDAARAAYRAAEDYRDASARAAEADANIHRRDALYTAAVRAAARADWLAALRDLRAVEAIQPGFRDSAQQRAQVEQQVYRGALGGSIALRPAADPPGLYFYQADRWVWLQDSDAASQVRGDGPGCSAVYDVPAQAAPPDQATGVPGTPAGSSRRLMVARRQGPELLFQPLVLDLVDAGAYTCGDEGVVAADYQSGPGFSDDPRIQMVDHSVTDATLHYQFYDRPVTTTFRLPGPAWVVLDRSRSGELAVLGDYTHNRSTQPHTDLYLADLVGNRRLVAGRDAVVQRAKLSPERRFLLLDELHTSSTGAGYEHQLVLLAVDGNSPPLILRRSAGAPAPGMGWFWTRFITSGIYAGKALIGGPPLWDNVIALIDPAHPEQVLWSTTSGNDEKFTQLYPLPSGLLLGWLAVTPTGETRFAYLDAQGRLRAVDLDLLPSESLSEVAEHAGSLVYGNFTSGAPDDHGLRIRVRSLPLTTSGAPRILGEYPLPSPSSALPGISWNFGSTALAIADKGELHALSYDGQVDLLLERGVSIIYHQFLP